MIRKFIAAMIMCAMITNVVYAGTEGDNIDETIFYSNDLGLELTKTEYDYLNQYINKYTFDTISENDYNYLIQDIEKNVSTCEEYVYSTYTEDENGNIETTDEILTEEEMINVANGRNVSLYFLADRKDTVTTAMKKITMQMYDVQPSAKTVSLTFEWLSIPKCKSFDVIAFRINKPGVTLNAGNTKNVQGYQYYDGKTISYPYNSNNIKYLSNGLGVSMNIVDSTSKSLVCTFKVTIGTGSDSLMVFGSYQHAVENVTLSQSQNYTLHTIGLGNVINFSDSVIKKYDATPGLEVLGSIHDIN